MERIYTVEGHWPFPLDMLRHDNARALSSDDVTLISRLSGDYTDNGFGLREKVKVRLVMEAGKSTKFRPGGEFIPNWRRWESFGWTVSDDDEVEIDLGIKRRVDAEEAARATALAKLTDNDKRALGLA